jgi:hypothetical protein
MLLQWSASDESSERRRHWRARTAFQKNSNPHDGLIGVCYCGLPPNLPAVPTENSESGEKSRVLGRVAVVSPDAQAHAFHRLGIPRRFRRRAVLELENLGVRPRNFAG